MVASVTAKTPPIVVKVGGTATIASLFTFTDSVATDYEFDSYPNANASITGTNVTFLEVGDVTISAQLAATPTIAANITVTVMAAPVPIVKVLSTKHSLESFNLTIVGVVSGGFDVKWHIELSADGINWFQHADHPDYTISTAVNIAFCVPYIKVTGAGHTVGSFECFAFGDAFNGEILP